jgi:hypothetical protein
VVVVVVSLLLAPLVRLVLVCRTGQMVASRLRLVPLAR